jgi:hypothetical protein
MVRLRIAAARDPGMSITPGSPDGVPAEYSTNSWWLSLWSSPRVSARLRWKVNTPPPWGVSP